MALDEVAARLAAAGVTARTGDLPYSLLKAWHGRPPVVREPDGRFGYRYDLAGRLDQVTEGGAVVAEYAYDATATGSRRRRRAAPRRAPTTPRIGS